MESLRKFTIEELQQEIERRKSKSNEKDFEVPFSKYSHMHRNYGWIPLRNYKIDKEYHRWLLHFLLPTLKETTGVEWFLDSYLVKVKDVSISLPTNNDDFTIINNEIVKRMMEKWPSLDEEDFGYKLEEVEYVDFDNDVYTYRGMWALNPIKIHDRGAIYSSKFGI